MPSRFSQMIATGLLALVAGGCATPAPETPRFALAPAGASLEVAIAPAGYAPLYLKAWDWDVVTASLRSPAGHVFEARAVAAVDPARERRAAALGFSGLSPGAGFTIEITLWRQGAEALAPVGPPVRRALTLVAGANALRLGPELFALRPSVAAALPLLPGFVTSLPRAGMAARLDAPGGVAVGPDGTVYLADSGNGCIRRVAPDAQGRPVVTMLAGTGYPGYTDGPAAKARFIQPAGLAVGPDGAVYVADTGNKVVRRIATDAAGQVTVATLRDPAGKVLPFDQPQALAFDEAGTLFVAERTRVQRLAPAEPGRYAPAVLAGGTTAGFADGDAATALFASIVGMIRAEGRLYVADAGNGRVRCLGEGPDGGMRVSTVPATFAALAALAPAEPGALWVADISRVERVEHARAELTALAGGPSPGFADGPATGARFSGIRAIAPDRAGALVVADAGNHRARRVSLGEAATVSTWVGDGERGNLNGPVGQSLALNRATSLAVDAAGAVVVADVMGHRLVRLVPDGSGDAVATPLAGDGTAGERDGAAASARFNGPAGVTVGPDGAYYVADIGNGSIRRIARDATGAWIVETVARGLSFPGGIVAAADGTLYVSEAGHPIFPSFGSHRVLRVTLAEGGATIEPLAGGAMGFADGTGAAARFNRPTGLAILPGGDLVVADAENHRLRRLTIGAGGVTVSTLAGDGTASQRNGPAAQARFNRPSGVAVDATGRVLVADYWNHRLQRLETDGTVVTVAGGPGDAYSDGPSAQARFSRPVGVAVGPDGASYVVDAYPHGVRRVSP